MDKKLEIQSKDEFRKFVRVLSAEANNFSNEWENGTVASYIAAMCAWLEDSDGFYANSTKGDLHSPWQLVADMLAAARNYE